MTGEARQELRTGTDAWGTARASRLGGDQVLVHADLHNHTRLSDGDGDPALAFASLRESGLDVAAITDHSVFASRLGDLVDLPFVTPFSGIDQRAWAELEVLADAAQDDGAFVALRGFEWSHPLLGHVNVWGTERYTDPVATLDTDLSRFYDWLTSADGKHGLASFNHPGGRSTLLVFRDFRPYPGAVDRFVGLEMFNKRLDYLFEGTDHGRTSPLLRCLDQGWRPGLTGVSDEHGDDWGFPEGKGRSGLWVDTLTRDGLREAMLARRTFATRLKGLRVDARLGGVRMGGVLDLDSPAVLALQLDVDRGEPWWGRPLALQVLGSGDRLPTVLASTGFTVPRPDEPVVQVEVPVDPADGPWRVLRLSDPAVAADQRATGHWAELGESVAYASPWWLRPG